MRNLMLSITKLLATNTRLKDTANKVGEILSGIVGPCLTALGSLGIIYMVILGVQYAKSENDEKRAEIKKRLVNLAIGVIVMLVMLTLCFAIKWDELIPSIFGGYYDAE